MKFYITSISVKIQDLSFAIKTRLDLRITAKLRSILLNLAALENDAHVNASMRFETNEIHRKQLLVPDLDTSGNPTCLSNPSDTFCESVQNYPR